MWGLLGYLLRNLLSLLLLSLLVQSLLLLSLLLLSLLLLSLLVLSLLVLSLLRLLALNLLSLLALNLLSLLMLSLLGLLTGSLLGLMLGSLRLLLRRLLRLLLRGLLRLLLRSLLRLRLRSLLRWLLRSLLGWLTHDLLGYTLRVLALEGRARRSSSGGLRVILGSGLGRLHWGLRVALLGRKNRGALSSHKRPMVRHQSSSGVRHQSPPRVYVSSVGVPTALCSHPNFTVHYLPVICKVARSGNVEVPRSLLALIRALPAWAGRTALLLRRVITGWRRNSTYTIRRRQLGDAAVAAVWRCLLLQAWTENRRRGGLLLLGEFGVPGATEKTAKCGKPLLLDRLRRHGGLATPDTGRGSGFDLGGGMDPTLALGFCRYSWRVGESSACPSVLVLSPPKSESDPMDGGRRNCSNDVLFLASVPSLVDTDVGVSVRAMGGGGFVSAGITAWATGSGTGNGCSGPFFLPRSAENLF